MIVYKYLSAHFGIKSIQERRLKISKIDELNDPFELLSINLSDEIYRSAHYEVKRNLTKTRGLISFSRYWNNSLMWGHYADRHKGLCLGFEIPTNHLMRVEYVKNRLHTFEPNENYIRKVLTSKSQEWSYEREYRSFAELNDLSDGMYYADFSENLILKKIFVGALSEITIHELKMALPDLNTVEVKKVKPASRNFRMAVDRNIESIPTDQ